VAAAAPNSQFSSLAQQKFQMCKSDLSTVFQHFGEVKDITIHHTENFALVTFAKILDAFMAQQALNKYFLKAFDLTL
jgi:hypothetical protein